MEGHGSTNLDQNPCSSVFQAPKRPKTLTLNVLKLEQPRCSPPRAVIFEEYEWRSVKARTHAQGTTILQGRTQQCTYPGTPCRIAVRSRRYDIPPAGVGFDL